MLLASVDVGSNTVRLLIGRVGGGKVLPVEYRRKITRLARGLEKTGRLDATAVGETLKTLTDYGAAIKSKGVVRARAVGTSALREAANAGEFIASAGQETGLRVEVISGEEESRLTALGVAASVPFRSNFFVIDVGGGSTEVMYSGREDLRESASFPTGVVKLMERHLREDPPSNEDMRSLRADAEALARSVRERFGGLIDRETALVGTAGTMTTIASIDLGLESYDREAVHLRSIPLAKLHDMSMMLASLPLEERVRLKGLETGRADLIIAGIILTISLMETLGFEKLVVSDSGILEGILLGLSREVPA